MYKSLRTAWNILIAKGLSHTLGVAIWKILQIRYNRLRTKTKYDLSTSAQIHGMKMAYHPSMRGLSEVIYLFGVHEPLTTAVYLKSLQPGDHVIEVGGNIGYYMLLARQQVGGSGRILIFEPVPENYAILSENAKPYDNIETLPCAVSRESGETEFHVSEIPNWGSLFYADNLNMTNTIQVPVVRLDDIVKQHEDLRPSLLHMDIEGGEILAMDGAWQTIERFKPHLLIEYHPFASGYEPVAQQLEKFRGMGYQHLIFIDRVWDEPWIPTWLRRRQIKQITIENLVSEIHAGKCSPNFSLLVASPNKTLPIIDF